MKKGQTHTAQTRALIALKCRAIKKNTIQITKQVMTRYGHPPVAQMVEEAYELYQMATEEEKTFRVQYVHLLMHHFGIATGCAYRLCKLVEQEHDITFTEVRGINSQSNLADWRNTDAGKNWTYKHCKMMRERKKEQ